MKVTLDCCNVYKIAEYMALLYCKCDRKSSIISAINLTLIYILVIQCMSRESGKRKNVIEANFFITFESFIRIFILET
jgi:hypothetical protein